MASFQVLLTIFSFLHKGIVPLVYSIFQYEWFNTTDFSFWPFVCSPFAGTCMVSYFDSRAKQNFNLASSAGVYLHGAGGRTVDKVIQYDLPFLKSQHSDIIISELGTNDLSFLSPEAVGSRLEDLVALLRDNLHVSVVAVR
jgi:hypothetical protein